MFKTISPAEYKENPFTTLEDTWALLAVCHEGKMNALTVSWGLFGPIWQYKSLLVNVRPQRHTRTLMSQAETFSVSLFGPEHKKMLGYMGSTSGANEDKIAKAGLTPTFKNGAPVFEEARLVMICKTLYTDQYKETSFKDKELPEKIYPQQDFHHFYIGGILEILSK